MKTKSIMKLPILLVMLMGLMLVSCENANVSSNSLVGTWSCSNHYYDGIDTYTFKSNGTYTWNLIKTCDCCDDKHESGDYSYNKEIGTLTLSKRTGRTEIYLITSVTKNYFVIMDDNADCYTYYKE